MFVILHFFIQTINVFNQISIAFNLTFRIVFITFLFSTRGKYVFIPKNEETRNKNEQNGASKIGKSSQPTTKEGMKSWTKTKPREG